MSEVLSGCAVRAAIQSERAVKADRIHLLWYVDGEYDGLHRRVVRAYRSPVRAGAECHALNSILRAYGAHESQHPPLCIEKIIQQDAAAKALAERDPDLRHVQSTGGKYYVTAVAFDEVA